MKTVNKALALLTKANAKAGTEAVQEILCELTEACEEALRELVAVCEEG